jgi:hypothetical protein
MSDSRADGAASALELAHGVTGAIPKSTMLRKLRVGRVPTLDEMDAGSCPRCGRSLPAVLASRAFMDRGGDVPDRELIARCLVDGPRAEHAQPIDPDDIVAAARVVADDLAAKGWTRWASVLLGAIAVPGTSARVEAVGQTLEMFRRYATVEIPSPAASDASPPAPLEILIASAAPHWSPR